MKSNHFGLQGVLFFALMLGLQCLPLQAQDQATVALKNGNDAFNKGDFDGAISDFDQAIALNPRYSEAYYCRGIAKEGKSDLDGAIADYSQAVALNPRYAWAYFNRGSAKLEKGDLDGAIADYTQA